jgi:predicted HTH transcriptional regulator
LAGVNPSVAAERRELPRRELVARFRLSREAARRELAGLVGLGLLHLVGRGRGARYVPLSSWLSFVSDMNEWMMTFV